MYFFRKLKNYLLNDLSFVSFYFFLSLYIAQNPQTVILNATFISVLFMIAKY